MAEPPPAHYELLPWVQPDWLAQAERWIRAQLEARACSLTGEIEQPHVRPWGTVLRVPTSEGDLYFKATAPVHHFEPRLIELLARRRPGTVPEPVSIEPQLGWILMRDGGTRLRELMQTVGDLHRWEELLPVYAELQIGLAPDAAELLALGVPDERLAGLPEHVEQLLEDREALLIDLPDGLTSEEHVRLGELAPDVASMCRVLAGYGIPETLQHDDLHDGNVFVQNGRYLFFDWGDSSVSHPFHTLVVALRGLAWKFELEPGAAELERVRDAYLEPFTRYARREELVAAAELAYRTGTIARALAWNRLVAARPPEFRAEDADAVPYGLKLFLAGGPIGTWR